MFGPRLTRVFASRRAALWWAGLILFSAWRVATSDTLAGIDSRAPAPAPSNPWALDTPAPSQP